VPKILAGLECGRPSKRIPLIDSWYPLGIAGPSKICTVGRIVIRSSDIDRLCCVGLPKLLDRALLSPELELARLLDGFRSAGESVLVRCDGYRPETWCVRCCTSKVISGLSIGSMTSSLFDTSNEAL
jgi:hypothetical protein